jgi:DNA-binding transcriptional regulator YhcF (GntR family)
MRPMGEISLALLGAMVELRTEVQAPTLRELAVHAQVGIQTAERTLDNMKRHGHVRIVRRRRVGYVNKPVAEYEPTDVGEQADGAGFVDLGSVISSAWR